MATRLTDKQRADREKAKERTKAARLKEREKKAKESEKLKAQHLKQREAVAKAREKAAAEKQRAADKVKADREKNYGLSPSEVQLLALIPRRGRTISTNDLIAKFYNGSEPPENARIITSGRMRSIMRKLDKRSADIVVKATPRAGPHPMKFWKEARA